MTWIRLRNIGLSLSFAGTLVLTACGSEIVRQSYAFRGELETATIQLGYNETSMALLKSMERRWSIMRQMARLIFGIQAIARLWLESGKFSHPTVDERRYAFAMGPIPTIR